MDGPTPPQVYTHARTHTCVRARVYVYMHARARVRESIRGVVQYRSAQSRMIALPKRCTAYHTRTHIQTYAKIPPESCYWLKMIFFLVEMTHAFVEMTLSCVDVIFPPLVETIPSLLKGTARARAPLS